MSQANCERCGTLLPADARFCPSCGLPVGVGVTTERKVVTLLFADLTGSTELSTQLDPERFREVMAAFYREVTDELESLRGRAENFAGDAVLGVFGVPQAHDDDALRAVRAALSLRERLERLGEELALPTTLRVRVGVNTGPVALAGGAVEQVHLAGAQVNLAARLQQAAEPGEVLVGETTRQLTRSDVEFGPRREVEAKGFEGGIPAWPVVALAQRSWRRTIPFVDRKRELVLLVNTFERVKETARGHMVTLFGEPGIGKSRLAEEFRASLPEGSRVLTGRASPFEEDVTFAPLAQMLLAELGEPPDAPPERLLSRLEEAVEACCPEEEVPQVVRRLAVALGIGKESRAEKRYRVAEVRAGLLDFLAGLSVDGPVVMVFEDVHLAQPALLDLIEQVVREARHVPIMVVCAARYGLLETRPEWGGGLGDSLNLYLEPMRPPDAVELAVEAGEGLDRETAERIAGHAGGNPFFIIETTGMLMHVGAEQLPTDTGPLPQALLPPTVQAVIASRIDHLPDAARDLLRKAAVFARSTFDVSELALIADPRRELLELLENEELLVHDEERQGVWRFRHGLLRDVAYESLAKRERQRLHLRVADRFSRPDMSERHPRAIAYHLEQAARASLDLNPKDRSLADRAVDALTGAADAARTGVESRVAAELHERALALAGPERAWGEREARILSGLGEARYWLGEFESALAPLSRALEIGGGSVWVRAHASRFLADIEMSIRGDRDRAGRLFDEALAAARELGDPWTLARTLLSAGWAPYWQRDLASARGMFEEALTIARENPERDAWAEARALVTLSTIISPSEDEEEALALGRQALAIGEKMGDPFTVAVARETVGNSLRRMWLLDDAQALLDEAARAYRQLGARWELASGLISLGVVLRLLGRIEEAGGELREALRICRELKERSIISWGAGQLALVHLARGDVEAAREVLDEGSSWLGPEDPQALEELLIPRVLIAIAEGDEETALARALRLVEEERERAWPNELAAAIWWAASLFGPDAVGGEEEVERARETLEAVHWTQALKEPALAGAPFAASAS